MAASSVAAAINCGEIKNAYAGGNPKEKRRTTGGALALLLGEQDLAMKL